MKNFFLLLIFSMLSAGIMLSGIAMKDTGISSAVTILLCLVAVLYLRRQGRKRDRFRYPHR